MKKSTIVEVISALLLVFYVHSVISIYIQLRSLKNLLVFYTVHISLVAWSILVIEAVAALLLFMPKTKVIGFVLSAVLTITAIIIVIITPHLPHDFGGIMNINSEKLKLALIILIAILSLTGFVIHIRMYKTKQSIADKSIYT